MVMVLGLLAVTLAISYATLRGQGTTSQLSRNNSRALDARVAAQSGLAAALRKIGENSWGGVDSTLQSNVTNNSWYSVSFRTGDDKLLPADTAYGEFPFRLTIEVTGTASDPLNPAVRSEHKSRCVVQLVRKKILSEPAVWPSLIGKTVYQYAGDNVYVQFPVRINGSAEIHGRLYFCTQYPNHSGSLSSYCLGLNQRRIAGLGDDRPFSALTARGLVTVQDTTTMTLLTSQLGATVTDTTTGTSTPINHPGSTSSYRLYPGGRTYDVTLLNSTLQSETLAPSAENPLGIYRTSGPLTIQSNVNVTGTIITGYGGGNEILVTGTNVRINAANLPSLYGSNQVYQLPAVLAGDHLRFNPSADAKISGTTMCWNEFELQSGAGTMKFDLTGNLITKALLLRGRTTSPNWVMTPTQWSLDRTTFSAQVSIIPYFPDYQQNLRGFTVKPALTFSPGSSGVTPHWHDWSQAVYQPDPADGGLRWEIVRWEDNLQ